MEHSESEKLQAQLEPLPDSANDGPEIAVIEQVTRAEHDDRVARLKQKHIGFPKGD